jgi:hypothetical protein
VLFDFSFIKKSNFLIFILNSKWIPRFCNDFYAGRGGYSTEFNNKRMQRISMNLGLNNANIPNLGSSWLSTPHQFRIAGFLSSFFMAYLKNEEFTEPEKSSSNQINFSNKFLSFQILACSQLFLI